jgi:hypothetical protein
MKYYETSFDDYTTSVGLYNLHPELQTVYGNMSKLITNFENIIMYGPPGVGKYSQILYLLKRYSNSELKYDKKITIQNDKTQYTYRISDIHYEIDMSLLGCNSKTLWHDIFHQILDIVTVKNEKVGIIVCKNFNKISTDLLEVFYSYMQQYNGNSTIKIRFVLLSDSISFIPTQIINACHVIKVKRPSTDKYKELYTHNHRLQTMGVAPHDFILRIQDTIHPENSSYQNNRNLFDVINNNGILNLKETRFFPLLKSQSDIPKDIFNIINDNIIQEILNIENISFTNLRETLYDILTYNLEISECIYYIITQFIETEHLSSSDASDILTKTYSFLKYFNNNYRPIYHLENIILYIASKVHNIDELQRSM